MSYLSEVSIDKYVSIMFISLELSKAVFPCSRRGRTLRDKELWGMTSDELVFKDYTSIVLVVLGVRK
jgi:hypothetical protein